MATLGGSGILDQESKAKQSSAKGADEQLAPTAKQHSSSSSNKSKSFMDMPSEEKAQEITKKVEEVKSVVKSVQDTMKDGDNVINQGGKKGG